MGDRYELDRRCVYCGKMNYDIWFAPTSNSMTFECDCGKTNFIKSDLKVYKIEDVTYEDVEEAISFTSNMMNEEQIKSCAKEFYDNLKGRKN